MTTEIMDAMPSMVFDQIAHPVTGMGHDEADAARKFKGLMLAATTRIRRFPTGFFIPSPDGPVVCNLNFCPCDEYAKLNGMPCVHVYAARAFHMREGGLGGSSIPDEVPLDQHYMAVAPSMDTTVEQVNDSSSASVLGMPLVTAAAQPPQVPPRPPNLTPLPEPEDGHGFNLDAWTMPNLRYPDHAGVDGASEGKKEVWQRKLYRDQRQYERAQMDEGRRFREILLDLVTIVPERDIQYLGRPRMPIGNIIYSLAMWVYSGKSLRRAMCDIERAVEDGLLDKVPSRASLAQRIGDPVLTPVLSSLIEASAAPLRTLETTFAADSTSFASSWKADTWHEYKHGGNPSGRGQPPRNKWAKAHLVSGVLTNVVTAAVVTPEETGDATKLPEMLETTDKTFSIIKLAADKGYISKDNLEAVVSVGAHPYMPFKDDALYRDRNRPGAELWNSMLWYFDHYKDEFYGQYHARSNVEAVMSSIKRLLGSLVRSQTEDARVNEVLLKILCFNLITLVHAIYEFGVVPFFKE